MKTIKLLQDIEHEGLVTGDVLSVDDNSAAALIRSGRAAAYDPEEAPASDTTNVVPEPKVTTYGDQDGVRTIDDIRDPEAARNRRVMSFATVAAADHGPVAVEPAVVAEPAAEPDAEVVDGTGATDTGTLSTSASDAGASAEADAPKASRPKPGKPGTTTTSAQAAPDAKSAGGDAGGGTA